MTTAMRGSELRCILKAVAALSPRLPLSNEIRALDRYHTTYLEISSIVDNVVLEGDGSKAIDINFPLHINYADEVCKISTLNDICLITQDAENCVYRTALQDADTDLDQFPHLNNIDFYTLTVSRRRLYEIVREAKRICEKTKQKYGTIQFEIEPCSNELEISYEIDDSRICRSLYGMSSAAEHYSSGIDIKLLYNVLKIVSTEQLTLGVSNNAPLKIEWLLHEKYLFRAFIAPRIE